jgi:hypothetical protein
MILSVFVAETGGKSTVDWGQYALGREFSSNSSLFLDVELVISLPVFIIKSSVFLGSFAII